MPTEAEIQRAQKAKRDASMRRLPTVAKPKYVELEKDYEMRKAEGEPVGEDRDDYVMRRIHEYVPVER